MGDINLVDIISQTKLLKSVGLIITITLVLALVIFRPSYGSKQVLSKEYYFSHAINNLLGRYGSIWFGDLGRGLKWLKITNCWSVWASFYLVLKCIINSKAFELYHLKTYQKWMSQKCFHFFVKVRIFCEGHKNLQNRHLTFVYSTYRQK